MTIEKTESGSAVVARVEEGGSADEAGVRRGDVVCWSGGGEAEFSQFMSVVQSGERPLEVDLKRIVVKAAANVHSSSAAEEQRRLAVVAAASERQKKANRNLKPVSKARPIDLKNNTKTYNHTSKGPQSEEARRAVQAAKDQEKRTAAVRAMHQEAEQYEALRFSNTRASSLSLGFAFARRRSSATTPMRA